MAEHKLHKQDASAATGHAYIFSEQADEQDAREKAERWLDLPPEPADPELIALREQLFRREIATINKIKLMLDSGHHSAREISKVISEAIVLRAAKDERLITALEPMVENIVTESMRLHQEDFVNALFPLMGPSIRKSIAENFRSMMGSFSKSLEVSISWKGLRWRLEALRSGKSFSEIVLLHTLIYRVEQVFFIHSHTGLVLSHLVNEGVGSQDADMISAMLTAIQDFARDCFASGHEGELESLQMGEFTIMIEKSSEAYLACVVRGTPPVDFRERMRNALDNLLVEYAAQLATFNGDTAPFRHSIRFLEEFMVSRYVEEKPGTPVWLKALPLLLIMVLAAVLGTSKWSDISEERSIRNALTLPEGVEMRLEGGTLVLSGEATLRWIIEAKDIARTLPGVNAIDTRALKDPLVAELSRLANEIKATHIEFPTGKAIPVQADREKLEDAVNKLVELEKLAASAGLSASLTIYGHADSTGTDQTNYEISRARAQTVAAMLYARGSHMPISMYGMGSRHPKGEKARDESPAPDQSSRRIELHVRLAQSVEPFILEEATAGSGEHGGD